MRFLLALLLGLACQAQAVVIPLVVQGSAINLAVICSTQSGVAPLHVQCHTMGTTSSTIAASCPANTAPVQAFHCTQYSWSFGDSGSGTWGDKATGAAGSISGQSRNSASGPIAAHVFETGGSYTITATAYDGTTTATGKVAITVIDPDTFYSGTNTICIANGTAPTAGAGGCPAGATVVGSVTDWPTVVSTYVAQNKRVLLKGGDIFTGAATATLTANGPLTVGSFPINSTKAILRTTGTTNFSVILTATGGTGVSGWRLMDLEIDGQSDGHREFMNGPAGYKFDDLTMLRLYIHHIGGGIELPCFNSSGKVINGLALVDSTISTLLSGSGESHNHGIKPCGRGMSILGNLFDGATQYSEHLIRVEYVERGVIAYNQLANGQATNPPGNKEMIGIRATCSNPAVCSSGDYFGSAGLAGDGAVSQIIGVNQNLILTNTYAGLKFGAVVSGDSFRMQNVVVERNYHNGTTGQAHVLDAGLSLVTVRNELVSTAVDNHMTETKIATAGAAATTGVYVFNNSYYNSCSSCNPRGFQAAVGTSSVVKNLSVYAPSVTSILVIGGAGTVTPANNSTDGQAKNTISITTAPPTTAANFIPVGYAIDGGTTVPVWSDFFLAPRTGTYDMGAVNP